jgi:hypothetical protein
MSQEQRPALNKKWCSHRYAVIRVRYRTGDENQMVFKEFGIVIRYGVYLRTTNRPVQQKNLKLVLMKLKS